MEEPYQDDYPQTEKFVEMFGPRDIVHSMASDRDDATTDPRWGRVGRQTITEEGPLPPGPNMDPNAKVDMTNVDEELVRRSMDFMERSVKADKPFFRWHNSTRCHVFTHLSDKYNGKSGFGVYADAMMEFDHLVGELLGKLDELGIADETIVLFTSDNGAEIMTWPDGGNHPFRGENGTGFEGGFRVPMLAKWPGTIKPGTIVNDVISAEDWMPTLLAAAGDPDVKEKLLTGMKVGEKTFKNHLDGYNFKPLFEGKVDKGPREEFFYFSDNGELLALRAGPWKLSFHTIAGNLFNGHVESTNLPWVTNLRMDPWERYQAESGMYLKWWGEKLWTAVPAGVITGKFLESFKEYPPSQAGGSWGVDDLTKSINNSLNAKNH
jgi:arylsulfatase A-like enzyme